MRAWASCASVRAVSVAVASATVLDCVSVVLVLVLEPVQLSRVIRARHSTGRRYEVLIIELCIIGGVILRIIEHECTYKYKLLAWFSCNWFFLNCNASGMVLPVLHTRLFTTLIARAAAAVLLFRQPDQPLARLEACPFDFSNQESGF